MALGDAGTGAGATVDLTPIENRLDNIEKNLGAYDDAQVEFIWESGLDAIKSTSKVQKLLAQGYLVKDMQYVEFTSSKSKFLTSCGILFVLQKSPSAKVHHKLVWCSNINFTEAKAVGQVPYKTIGFAFKENNVYKSGFLFVFQS